MCPWDEEWCESFGVSFSIARLATWGRHLCWNWYCVAIQKLFHKTSAIKTRLIKQLVWLWLSKGPVTRCNFSCNLQRNSPLKRCKFVTNVWYVKNILANCDGNLYLPILHLSRVELHCKLQKKIAPCCRALNYNNITNSIRKIIIAR